VSDGFGFYIEPILDAAGLGRLEVLSNEMVFDGGAPTLRAQPLGDVARAMRQPGHFDALEEEFFGQEKKFTDAKPPPVESFEDLDEGEPEPQGFWRRLFSGPPQPRRKRPPTQPPVGAGAPAAAPAKGNPGGASTAQTARHKRSGNTGRKKKR